MTILSTYSWEEPRYQTSHLTVAFTVRLKEAVAELLPEGVRKLGRDRGWEWSGSNERGDADGINELYDDKYVFIFKFKDGKIATLHEYNGDLLVATRLYKQKLVADD